jgi:hypothetical protein
VAASFCVISSSVIVLPFDTVVVTTEASLNKPEIKILIIQISL